MGCMDYGRALREKLFVENGSILLEKLIASCSSRSIPIRSFSIEELLKATNNYDPFLRFHENGSYQWYKGSLEGRLISVKKYRNILYTEERDFPFTDMVICAKMCAHKNVLKLIGCCLETPSPIAHAIAYLHTAFSRPIIHRDIKPGNIFFDQRDIPKLSDFSMSIEIPEGEFEVKDDHIVGTYGFLCPFYVATGIVTEKSDVHGFGSLLLELVTGKTWRDLYEYSETASFINFEDRIRINIVKIVESAIQAGEVEAGLEQQLQASLELAQVCIDWNPEFRPTMIDVTKELRRIERCIP
ncbi:hypothetical protein CIPAW_08G148700 [Carya illinoinensis]|uniref:Protein kinase domain-containing protein n=1 Tax=Carya illinoinensis TaxID=32201 RepID=A0A8T1PNL0_CARIL|nr:hypothetical protein CIPAW_08G148700 [Carya illinoinensis]